MSELEKAMKWCNEHNIRLKVQPTLWTANINEYKEIIDFFIPRGVRWFSFHAGSCECFVTDTLSREHVDPWKWRAMIKKLGDYCNEKNISLHMPYLFLNDREYEEYIAERGRICSINKLNNTQIWLEDNYIRTTHCPLLCEVFQFQYNLYKNDNISYKIKQHTSGYCPISKYCLGLDLSKKSVDGAGAEFIKTGGERLHSICRLYNFNVNYPKL